MSRKPANKEASFPTIFHAQPSKNPAAGKQEDVKTPQTRYALRVRALALYQNFPAKCSGTKFNTHPRQRIPRTDDFAAAETIRRCFRLQTLLLLLLPLLPPFEVGTRKGCSPENGPLMLQRLRSLQLTFRPLIYARCLPPGPRISELPSADCFLNGQDVNMDISDERFDNNIFFSFLVSIFFRVKFVIIFGVFFLEIKIFLLYKGDLKKDFFFNCVYQHSVTF